MRSYSYPQCCTTDVLAGMGKSPNQDYEAQRASTEYTLDDMLRVLRDKMEGHRQRRKAMLTCITTQQQELANTALRALGWRCGPWAASGAHTSTKTRLWYWLVQDGVPDLETTRNKLGLTKP